jgi:hypothetical protein
MLARLIHVHVKTLYAAARDGRLHVTYDTRTTFRRLRARATVADVDHFWRAYFEKAVWPKERSVPLSWHTIPADYADRIKSVRQRLGLSQAAFDRARRRRAQGRRVPVGIAEALPLPSVLATDSGAESQRRLAANTTRLPITDPGSRVYTHAHDLSYFLASGSSTH